ncbi:MAG: MBL fold metallo-hydrolase [Candidatus Omnitrophota bacterium]
MKVKIVFDQESIDKKYSCGWGVSYLVDEKVLFDTGEKPEYLLNNLKAFDISLKKIKKAVISHNHWDHRGGLWGLLEANNSVEVFACLDFFEEFRDKVDNYNFKLVDRPIEIDKNIHTTGCVYSEYKEKALREQSLILKTEKGLSIICGCAHFGVLKIIDKVRSIFPQDKIYSLIGGFHLIDKDNRFIKYVAGEMKSAGVENIGPAHCSGIDAINIFKEVYEQNFLEVKVGIEIEV